MKQKYVIGLAILLAISLITQMPFGLTKQEETNNPFELILSKLQSLEEKLETVITLLTIPEPTTGPGYNAPEVQSVTYYPIDPEVGDIVFLDITVYDEDISVYGFSQTLDIYTEFIQLPPLSTAEIMPTIGHTPALILDRSGDYGVRVTVTDDTGRYGWYELTITVAETPPP